MDIRPMRPEDREAVLEMMRDFYASPAMIVNGGEAVYRRNIEACLDESFPFVQGWLFTDHQIPCGYSILARSYSAEYGMPCIWVEDLYFRKEYRGRGYADRFFAYLKKQWQDRPVRFRLEVEQENAHACHVYRKNGWKAIGYLPLEDLSEAGKLLMETYMNNPLQN